MQDKPDWFKLHPAAFLQDSVIDAMSSEELGATIRLLCRQWMDGHIPDDTNLLGRLCRMNREAIEAYRPMMELFFPLVGEGQRANRYMWVERETVTAAMQKKRDDGRDAVNRRWSAIRDLEATNRSPIPDLIQEQEEEKKEKKKKNTPLPPKGAKPPKEKKQPQWATAYPEAVVSATAEILSFWPQSGKGHHQPNSTQDVPNTSAALLAGRLAEIEKTADMDVCVEIARSFVSGWQEGKNWLKAAQYFFGRDEDAPFRAYYRAELTSRAMEVENEPAV